MAIRVKVNERPRSVTRTVTRDFGTFEIKIRTPELEERFRYRSLARQHDDKYAELAVYLYRFLIGWNGINDENGQPIPFDDRVKSALLAGNEMVATVIAREIADYFDEDTTVLAEDEVKNCEVPPENTSTVAPTTTT